MNGISIHMRFIPPPPHAVMDALSDLETFLHAETPEIPALIKVGLAHAQFETIHPFLDGTGRVGRLLITFLLCEADILRRPYFASAAGRLGARADHGHTTRSAAP